MADIYFSDWIRDLGDGYSYLATGVKAVLIADTFVPTNDLMASISNPFVAEIKDHEVSGDGYTADGKVITDSADFIQNPDGSLYLQHAFMPQVEWPNSTITARWVMLYIDANNSLMCLLDLGGNVSSNNSTFTVPLADTICTVNANLGAVTGNELFDLFYTSRSAYYYTARFFLLDDGFVFDVNDSEAAEVAAHIVAEVYTGDLGVTFTTAIDAPLGFAHKIYMPSSGSSSVTFPSVTGTFRYLVCSRSSSYTVIAQHDFGSNQTATAEDVVVTFDTGFIRIEQV